MPCGTLPSAGILSPRFIEITTTSLEKVLIFSNTPGSEMSSRGFYLTAETYQGSNGLSLVLDGLSTTNSNARSRAIVIHGAEYVSPGSLIGRSWGCPALDMRYYIEVINQIKGGVLIYAE